MRLWINIQSFKSPCIRELSVECGNNKLGMSAVGSQVAGQTSSAVKMSPNYSDRGVYHLLSSRQGTPLQ